MIPGLRATGLSLAFVRAGALARTSSGKLMRYRCRQGYLRGDLPVLERFDAPARVATAAEPA